MNRTTDDVTAIILDSLSAVSPAAGPANVSTPLLGDGAVVDSVGFVTLLVTLEQNLGGGVDLSESFLEYGDARDNNPFRTVGSLAEFIHRHGGSRP